MSGLRLLAIDEIINRGSVEDADLPVVAVLTCPVVLL